MLVVADFEKVMFNGMLIDKCEEESCYFICNLGPGPILAAALLHVHAISHVVAL